MIAIEEGLSATTHLLSRNKDIKTFCEIGSINSTILDEAKKKGWETTRVDINPDIKDENHKVVIGDIEDPNISWNLKGIDCMWMSHVVEHLKDPVRAMINMLDCLADGGLLFISMPDPYFIDWNIPSQWGHWAMREHHIMWDMDSFIELMEEIGYETVYSKRRQIERDFVCIKEYVLLFRKVQK